MQSKHIFGQIPESGLTSKSLSSRPSLQPPLMRPRCIIFPVGKELKLGTFLDPSVIHPWPPRALTCTWSAFVSRSYVLHRPRGSGPLDPLDFGPCAAGRHHHPVHVRARLRAGGELASDLLQPRDRHPHLDVPPAPLCL